MMADDRSVCIPLVPNGVSHPVAEPHVHNPCLERGLDTLYTDHLRFPYNHPEVQYLTTGIESLVWKIVEDLCKNKHILFDKDSLAALPELRDNDEHCLSKTGSFYEQTRTIFPDEFDFVFCPFSFEQDGKRLVYNIAINEQAFNRRISFLVNSGRLIHSDKEVGDIFYESFNGRDGTAFKLKFTFIRSMQHYRRRQKTRLKKTISVSLIPGIRVNDPNLEHHIDHMCAIQQLKPCVLECASSGYFLLPDCFVSFADSEINFMRNILSGKHVKVYMLLKHLINGNDTRLELLETCSQSRHHITCAIPSSAIKTAMVSHHYSCTDASTLTSPCVMAVLDMLLASFQFPGARLDDKGEAVTYVEIATLASRPLTIAQGPEDFILSMQTTFRRFISYLKNYSDRAKQCFTFDTLSTHFMRGVKLYNLRHASKLRRYRADVFDDFGLNNIGHCCYNILIGLCVIAFFTVLIMMCAQKAK